MLWERSVHGCRTAKHKTYRPLDDHWVIRSTSKAFDYFRARRDETRFTFDFSSFVDYITVDDRVRDSLRNIFLKRYFTIRQQVTVRPEELSKCFSKRVLSVTLY